MGSPEVQKKPLPQHCLLKGIFGSGFAGPGSYKALMAQMGLPCASRALLLVSPRRSRTGRGFPATLAAHSF